MRKGHHGGGERGWKYRWEKLGAKHYAGARLVEAAGLNFTEELRCRGARLVPPDPTHPYFAIFAGPHFLAAGHTKERALQKLIDTERRLR